MLRRNIPLCKTLSRSLFNAVNILDTIDVKLRLSLTPFLRHSSLR